MSFTQQSGNPVSFIGTDSNDTLVLTAGQPFSGVIDPSGVYDGGAVFVQAEGANDIVTTNGDVAGVTIYGGSGNDDIDANGNGNVGQFTDGQVFMDSGDDIFTYNNLVTSGVNGGDGADTITAGSDATSTASSINGNGGDDSIFVTGRAGDTGVYGGQGLDTITVSTGTFVTSSMINGNKGADVININTVGASASAWSGTEVRGGQDGDVINLLEGTANLGGVYGDLGNDRIVGTVVSELTGGAFPYALGYTPDARGGFTVGSTNPYSQVITAYAGEITADGGAGNDNIQGGSANDNLNGGLNADVINGRAGDDILTGGQGAFSDTFVFGNGTSIFTVSTNAGVATQAIVANNANGGLSATAFAGALASIDALIGTDVVTDYDLATDDIQLSNSTFLSVLAYSSRNALTGTTINGTVGAENSGFAGDFGVSTDGVNITWFEGFNGAGGSSASNVYGLVYDQTTGNLFFVGGLFGDSTNATSTASIVAAQNLQTINSLSNSDSHLIATFANNPDINGSNYSNEITIIA